MGPSVLRLANECLTVPPARCQALARRASDPRPPGVREGYLDTIRARVNWTESIQIP
jgi:hypothetical protein